MFKKTVYTTLAVGLALLLLATLRLALDTPGATANMQSVTQSSSALRTIL